MNSPATHRALEHAHDNQKRLATAQARAAYWGGSLLALEGDDGKCHYVVSRWALTRAFPDIASVESFLDQVGALA